MKNIWFALILVLAAIHSQAQKNIFIYGADLVIPGDHLAVSTNTGWGTTIRCERVLKSKLNATATLSFLFFGKKTWTLPTIPPTVITSKSTMAPIQLGLKYFLIQNQKMNGLFVNGESGVHVINYKGTINGRDVPIQGDTRFSYSLGIGYKLNDFEIAFKQQFFLAANSTFSYSNVRLSWILRRLTR